MQSVVIGMRQSNLKVAITGGIGSGKSTACKIIKKAGYPVFSCDETYAKLFDDGYFTGQFVTSFGDGILDADGNPSRKKISEIVFGDEEKLKLLNEITHPIIFKKMFEEAENVERKICFYEVPLLFEGGYQSLFDNVVVILREEEERIKSVMGRDKISEEEVLARINKQHKYDFSDIAKYYVIYNSGTFDEFEVKIHELLLDLTCC